MIDIGLARRGATVGEPDQSRDDRVLGGTGATDRRT
jgi:hypothetical protein